MERIYLPNGLEEDDCKSVSMGVSGVDVLLSPAARKVMDLAIECKNVENLNHSTVFWKHAEKYANFPVLVSKKNRTEPIATLRLSDLLVLLEQVYVRRMPGAESRN